VDRFTRNYSIALAAVILVILAFALYEDPQVSELNDLLEREPAVAGYPYRFQVLRVANGIAVISTPRSSAFPVYRALGIIDPHLANRSQEDPDVMKAQQELAEVQKRVKSIVTESDGINRVQWELDRNWLSRNGVQLDANS